MAPGFTVKLRQGREVSKIALGDPATVLRGIAFPVYQILITTTITPDIKDPIDFPCQVTIRECLRWRRCGCRSGVCTERNRLNLRYMENRVNLHVWRKCETDRYRVQDGLHRKRTNVARGKFSGGARDGEILGPEVDWLAGDVDRGRDAASVCCPGGPIAGQDEGSAGLLPDTVATSYVLIGRRHRALRLLGREQRWIVAQRCLEG